MWVALMTLSSHLVLCRPLLLLPSHFPNISVFSRDSSLLMRWPKYWSLSFRNCPSSKHSGLISFRMDRFVLLAVRSSQRMVMLYPFQVPSKTLIPMSIPEPICNISSLILVMLLAFHKSNQVVISLNKKNKIVSSSYGIVILYAGKHFFQIFK